MDKLLLIGLLLVTGNPYLFAQEAEKRNILGVHAGLAIPCFDFANKTFERDAGFARLGGNVEVDFLRYECSFFGYGLNLGYSFPGFDSERYRNSYTEILDDQGISVTAGNYHIFKGTIGVLLKTPPVFKTEFMFIHWFGYTVTLHPEIVVASDDYGEINYIEGCTGKRAIMGFTLRANYNVTERMGISLSYRVNHNRPHFPDETSPEGGFRLPIRYHNVNVGVYIDLRKRDR
jgi:hypothetical protein